MKKKDLIQGHIAVFRDGKLGLFVAETFISVDNGGISLDFLTDDLLDAYNGDCDIMELYVPKCGVGHNANFNFWFGKIKEILKPTYSTRVWKREEIVELTMGQIAEKFDINVDELRIKE